MTIWQELPGQARDIGVDANGIAWKIGTHSVFGGYDISRWNEGRRDWDQVPGGGVRITCAGTTPYVVNDQGRVYRGDPASLTWKYLVGGARDVGVDPDGSMCMITKTAVPGGFSIRAKDAGDYRWRPLSNIGVVEISGARNALVVNDRDYILHRVNQGFLTMSGSAKDVAISDSHQWVIGTNAVPGGFGIYSWETAVAGWVAVDGGGVRIACGGPRGAAWVVSDEGKVSRRIGYDVRLQAHPYNPPLRRPVTVTIDCHDADYGVLLAGDVYINDTRVGQTNTPFTYIFRPRAPDGDLPSGYVHIGKAKFPIDFGFVFLTADC
jgi:hypothetical protein